MGIGLNVVNKTVATAGTRIQLTSSTIYATAVFIEAHENNTGTIYVGNSTVASTTYTRRLLPGTGFQIAAEPNAQAGQHGGMLDLSKIYFDASANAQVVMVTYLDKLGNS